VKFTESAHVGGNAASPGVDAESPSAASEDTNHHFANASNYKARTISLLNVPDTVNVARIRKMFEKHGALVKCSLRTDHGGAIAEYVDESSVGKAELDLDGKELDGNVIRTGTVDELLKARRQYKSTKLTDRKKPAPATNANTFANSRPGRSMQPLARGGRKGGLGFKRAAPSSTEAAGDSEKAVGGKSNDYFKNLMAGKKEGSGTSDGGDKMET
jgi:RNA recognition motif-containing protein